MLIFRSEDEAVRMPGGMRLLRFTLRVGLASRKAGEDLLRRQGRRSYQPRATPWVHGPKNHLER